MRWHLETLFVRETPELPAEVTFSDIETGVLRDFATDGKPPKPLDLGTPVPVMAMFAGCRKHDGPFGHKVGRQLAAKYHGAGPRIAEPGVAAKPCERLRSDKTCD